jgi:hypothetical protein
LFKKKFAVDIKAKIDTAKRITVAMDEKAFGLDASAKKSPHRVMLIRKNATPTSPEGTYVRGFSNETAGLKPLS